MTEQTFSWLPQEAPDLDHRGPKDIPFRRFERHWTDRPAIELFAEVAERRPDAIACEDSSGGVTFAEVWRAARRLAATLAATLPDAAAVGVLLPNEKTYAAAVLACLGAARPCVLIDRNYPQDRVSAVIRDAGLVAIILSAADIASGYLLPAGVHPFAIEEAFAASDPPAGMPSSPAAADAPSFIVYTSGSTGKPKGIALSQRAVLHRAAELVNAVHLHEEDKVLSLASPGTIGGLQQIFEVMLAGATLVKLDLQRIGLGQVLQAVRQRAITMMFSTPALWRSVAQLDGARESLVSLRCIQSSGEILLRIDYELIRKVLPGDCAVLSVYGATEAPALLQWFVSDPPAEESRVPVGYPLPDIDLCIVDEHGRAAADNEAGELVVRSAFTSLGIWVDGKAVPDPFEEDPSSPELKTYRTGDLVRRRSDGLYVVLGRRDRQIKVRGNRVELAEIETALRRLPDVRDAAVIARVVEGDTRLLGFVVPRSPVTTDFPSEVRASLAESLPSYMRPGVIHVVDAVPLLPGRKVDEEALLAIASGHGDLPQPAVSRTADTGVAATIRKAWRAVTGRAPRPG